MAPVFFLVLFGIIDGARMVFAYNAVSQASREGARLAAVQAPYIGKSSPCGAPVCPSATAFRTNVLAAVNGEMIGAGPVGAGSLSVVCTAAAPVAADWTTPNNCTTSNGSGNLVSVRAQISFTPLFPFSPLTLAGTATMNIP